MPDMPQPATKEANDEPDGGFESPGASTDGRPPGNLPLELSSFVGRGKEVAEVGVLLAGNRLLTLTGPGGSGKTRLALAVAREVVEKYEDGAWFVELAPLSDPELVPQAVASLLGVRETPGRELTDTLTDHLRPRTLLLVLDNCEHLVDASASLAEALLRSCPNLRVLATSRQALGVEGEALFVVPPLSLPDPRRLPVVDGLHDYEAAGLFVERARAVGPRFEVTERNATAVAQICHRLDGMPLAIELAAARTRTLSVEQISSRLDDAFSLLSGRGRPAVAHQGTLRATMDWSHGLLSAEEGVLFRRLSVFAGGFALEAAEEVCAGDGIEQEGVIDLIASLADKSLVTVDEREGEARYRLLETIRQFGREKLEESTETPEVSRRHAQHYLSLAERAEPELLGPDQGRWLQRLRTELGNLRAALSWSAEPEQERECAELRLRTVAALGRFWGMDNFEEGKRWLRTALEEDPGGFPVARAKALGELGFILLFQQDYGPAIATLDEAVALYKELGDESGAAFALANLGWAVLHGDYRERVPTFIRQGEALIEGDLNGPPRAYLSIVLGSATVAQGNLDLAASRLGEALAMCRELGNLRDVSMALFNLGGTELRRGKTDRAARAFEEGARISRELGEMLGTAYYIWMFGNTNARLGRPIRAARLWGAAEALREQMGMSFSRFDLAQSGYERDLASVHSALSGAAFEAAWAEGRAMPPEQAIGYALEAEEPAAQLPGGPTGGATIAAATTAAPSSPLSGREAEVLRLAAEGLTDAQAAQRLYLSPRTVGRHLHSAYRKLGVSSRAAATKEALERGLI